MKKLDGIGLCTINGLLQCNNNISNIGSLSNTGNFELGPTGTNLTYIDENNWRKY